MLEQVVAAMFLFFVFFLNHPNNTDMLLIHPQMFLKCEKMHVSHVKYFIHNVLFIDPVTLHQEREPFSSLSIGQALRLSESIFFIFYLHFFFFYIQGKCSFLIVNKYKTLL